MNNNIEKNLQYNKNKNVVELFAGVGGFRIGLEKLKNEGIEWNTVLANQWEPSNNGNKQFAFECYDSHFKNTNSINLNIDISKVMNEEIPDHQLLVGGFPCQDYSVANNKSKGIEGKKGVLWWEIYRIVNSKKPNFILLENVDRLLKSPTKQRGRDFAIMLKCLDNLNYNVEWKVINAADFGFAQRRRRVFIFAYKNEAIKNTKYDFDLEHLNTLNMEKYRDYMLNNSFFNNLFPSSLDSKKLKNNWELNIKSNDCEFFTNDFNLDIQNISDNWSNMFRNSGSMIDGRIVSFDTVSNNEIEPICMKDILEKGIVDPIYFLNEKQIESMKKAKGGKTVERISKEGFTYTYTEGSMSFPENIDLPSRTMLTSEGSVNRSTHVVEDIQTGKLRFITPIEAERLNGFPDNWTDTLTKRQRYFCMGNALVTDIITVIGREISNIIDLN